MFTATAAIAVLAVLGTLRFQPSDHRNASAVDPRREDGRDRRGQPRWNARGYLEDRFDVMAVVGKRPGGPLPESPACIASWSRRARRPSGLDSLGYIDSRMASPERHRRSPGHGSPPVGPLRSLVRDRCAWPGARRSATSSTSRVTHRPALAFGYPAGEAA